MSQKPWRQLAFILGEAGLSLLSSGVLFIIISRVSGPELLGTYALAFAWLMLFQSISSFGIPEFLIREVGIYGRDGAGQVVHAMLLGLGSGFVALCLMLAAAHLVGYSAYLVQVISISSLALIPAFLNTACRSVFLALRKMQLTFLALLVEVAIIMTASLYLLFSGFGAIALMITLVVAKAASASMSLVFLYNVAGPMRASVNLESLKATAKTVFVFGLGSMLGMLTMRINTIMVSVWVDLSTVGQYAAATKIMEIGLIVPNLFVQLLMPRIAYSFNKQGNRDPNRFGAWYRVLFALIMPACVGGWVFAGPVLEAMFGTGFGTGSWILRILMIYLAIESADALMSVILQAAHRQREDVIRLAFNPLSNILLNLALLPALGTIGAVIGRVGGVAVSAGLRDRLIAGQLTRMNWLPVVLKPALISIGVGSICYPLLDVARPIWLLLFYTAATALLLKLSGSFSASSIKDMLSSPSISDEGR